jgi:tetratricopeptide (TPR) repeat protein
MNPAVTAYQDGLAKAYHNLGNFYRETRQTGKAEQHYQQALKAHESLVTAHPTRADFRENLALVQSNLGELYYRTGRLKQAASLHATALALLEPLVRDHPNMTTTAVRLSIVYRGLGNVWTEDGRLAESLSWFNRAIEVAEQTLRQAPADFGARQALANAYFARAYTLTRLGRLAEGQPDWERAIALAERRDLPRCWFHRAHLLAQGDQHAPAAAAAERLLEVEPADGSSRYNAACVYALSAAAARQDEQMAPTDRDALAERYAARAVALLAQAQAAGYFATPANRDRLRKDPDLQALRTREDFRKWLAELEQAAPPHQQPPAGVSG